jgi:peptide/nickel transport system permease protein
MTPIKNVFANEQSFLSLFVKGLKKDKLALFGLILLVMFLIVGTFSTSIAPYEARERHRGEDGRLLVVNPPSREFPFGTTNVGRDIYSQVILGTRTALVVGLLAAFLVTVVGSVVGIVAGFYGGWVDTLLMRIVDFFYAIPFIPFVIVLSAVLSPSIFNVILAVSLLSWRTVARLVRSQVLSVVKRPYIKAGRVAGASNFRLMTRYVLPNVLPLILLEMAFMVNNAIAAEASIAFLGFGDPDVPSWGQILHIAFVTGYSRVAWWWILAPGLAIVLLLLSVFFVARALEEVVDPRLRGRA